MKVLLEEYKQGEEFDEVDKELLEENMEEALSQPTPQ